MATLFHRSLRTRFWQPFKRRYAFNKPLYTATVNPVRYHGNHHHDDHHHSDDEKSLFAQHLTNRGLVEISGVDSIGFLQGLITSDMACFQHIEQCTGLFTALLNPQGRLLYDIILYGLDEQTFWAECDVNAVDDVIKMLKLHRLRKKISIENNCDGLKIWSLFGDVTKSGTDLDEPEFIDEKFNLVFVRDPRLKNFGWRLILPEHTRMENTVRNAYECIDEDRYRIERYKLGIAEGMNELTPAKAFPLESNFAFLNGVSFSKGCYVGQELTARTFHTGVTRKRIMPLKFDKTPEIGSKIQNEAEKAIGTVTAAADKYGLGLVRISNLNSKSVTIASGDEKIEAEVSVPKWWPLGDDELKKVGFSLTP